MKERLKRFFTGLRWAILSAIAVGVVSSIALNTNADNKDGKTKAQVHVIVDNRPLNRENGALNSFAPVVESVSQSVVNVFTTKKGRTMDFNRELPPMFRPFFRGQSEAFQTPDQHGLGSGVIVSADGYILTNNHVVEQADEIKVALNPDGREFDAALVGKDPKSDIAILKINASNLPALKMTDSDQIKVGDLVLAIGNPFGIGQTVTMGMVSAMGRGSLGLDYEDFIQTDAAINPGNSGGALVDMEGRLIGINTAILSRSGGNQGIGFAIPVNLARMVMESIIEHGYVDRGFLGVMIQDLNSDLARGFRVPVNQGALVTEVTPDGAADRAGIREGDVIVGFNGNKVRDSRQLKAKVGQTPPGESVTVELYRNKELMTKNLELNSLKDQSELAERTDRSGNQSRPKLLSSVQIEDLNPINRREWNIPTRIDGVLISDVLPGSAAFEAGLRPGQVIQEINRVGVSSVQDAMNLDLNAGTEVALVKIWTERGSRYLVVDESNMG